MRRGLWFLLKLSLFVGAAVWLANHPGAVQIRWGDWQLDTSLAVLALLLLVILACTVWLTGLFVTAQAMILRANSERRLRRLQQGQTSLMRGLVAIASGNKAHASKEAKTTARLLGPHALSVWLAAESARLNGDAQQANDAYAQLQANPATAALGLRGLIEGAVAQGQHQTAQQLASSDAATALQKAPWLLATRFALEAKAGNWVAAHNALAEARKRKALPEQECIEFEAALFVAEAAQEAQEQDYYQAIALAEKALKLRSNWAPAAVALAHYQQQIGEPKAALATLTRTWQLAPHAELSAALSKFFGNDTLALAAKAQEWQQLSDDHIEGWLLLAEASLKANLSGQAQAAITQAQTKEQTRRVYRLAARIGAARNDVRAERIALEAAATALDAGFYSCAACGHHVQSWSADCPSCKNFATLAWVGHAPEKPAAN